MSLSPGTGSAVSGGLQAFATVWAAEKQAKQAAKDRELKRQQANSENLLKINQFNMNQDRLAGLAGTFSGDTAAQEKLIGMTGAGIDETKYAGLGGDALAVARNSDINRLARENATSIYKGKGDYSTLNAKDYVV